MLPDGWLLVLGDGEPATPRIRPDLELVGGQSMVRKVDPGTGRYASPKARPGPMVSRGKAASAKAAMEDLIQEVEELQERLEILRKQIEDLGEEPNA